MSNDTPKPDADGWFRRTLLSKSVDSMISGVAADERKEAGSNAFQLSYDCPPNEMKLLFEIGARAVAMYKAVAQRDVSAQDVIMDIATVHCNGKPLKLLQLLMSDNADFQHDIAGMRIHLDRRTGQLRHGWVPLFGELKQ